MRLGEPYGSIHLCCHCKCYPSQEHLLDSMTEQREAFALALLQVTSRGLTPAVMSERLGLTPTGVQTTAAESSGSLESRRGKSHVFTLEATRKHGKVFLGELSSMLDSALDELLHKIEPVAEKLAGLKSEAEAVVICGYYTAHDFDCFTLSESMLQRMAVLRLPLMFCQHPAPRKTHP